MLSRFRHSKNQLYQLFPFHISFVRVFFLYSPYLKKCPFCGSILIEECFIIRERVLMMQRGSCCHLSGDAGVDTVQTMSVLKHSMP